VPIRLDQVHHRRWRITLESFLYVQKTVVPCLYLLYVHHMKIVYDEPKRLTNLTVHGLDFADLDMKFFAAATTYPGKKGRLVAVGDFEDIVIAVVFRTLGSEAISIISMRYASRKERSDHEKN
jgi:uncharacterized protein